MTLPGNRTACPQCGAAVRLDAAFCGQCYADFRPPPPPSAPVTPTPTASYGVPAPDPLTAPLLDVVLPASTAAGLVPAQGAVPPAAAAQPVVVQPEAAAKAARPTGWPCSRCETVNDFDAPLCGTCGSAFLSQVAEETKIAVVLPIVGDLNRYSRGQRAGIAFAAIVVVLIPLALMTLLMTGKPPASRGGTTGTPVTSSDTTSNDTTTNTAPLPTTQATQATN